MKKEQTTILSSTKLGTFRTSTTKGREALKEFSATTLKRIAKVNGIPTSGSKEAILQRLSKKKVTVHINIELVEKTTQETSHERTFHNI